MAESTLRQINLCAGVYIVLVGWPVYGEVTDSMTDHPESLTD